jgi:Zn-dependent protease with chaperone function
LSRTGTAATAPRVTEWEPEGGPAPDYRKRGILLWFAASTAPWLVLAVLAPRFGVPVALAAVALQVVWLLAQPRLLLSNASPARAGEHSRLINLATGLAHDLAMSVPRLYVTSKEEPNAFVLPGTIVVTSGLLSSYTRTELEAVVAHCLVRLREGGIWWAVAAVATFTTRSAPRVDRYVDARTAAVTRYPPGLAAALRKATIVDGRAVPVTGRDAPLWFVADASSHAPTDERVAELLDL